MSRWWRAYEEAATDPKLQLLQPELFRTWFNLMCIASKNDGELPALAHIAYTLQMKPEKAAQALATLHKVGLLDKTETGFAPHNWNGRQYKSDRDVTAANRSKRYRDAKRSRHERVTRDATETSHPPETDTETDISEANASGAVAPVDHRKRLFDEGLQKLAKLTGKGPDACRSFVGKCLKAAGDDAVTVLGLIEDAERNQVVQASAWIAARLKSTGPPPFGKPMSAFQQSRKQTQDILDDLDNFATGRSGGDEAHSGFLSGNPGERSKELRGGTGSAVIDLPATSYRAGN